MHAVAIWLETIQCHQEASSADTHSTLTIAALRQLLQLSETAMDDEATENLVNQLRDGGGYVWSSRNFDNFVRWTLTVDPSVLDRVLQVVHLNVHSFEPRTGFAIELCRSP